MAAFGKGVDALSIASPVLKSGPSAYEVVTARMGIEGDNAKLAAAKDAEKAKARAERGKAFDIDLGTVELPDTIAWNKKMAQEQDLYAAELQAFEEGKGDDPDDPRSKAGQARMARLQGYKQYVSNSKQKMAYGNTLLGLVRSKPHAYQPGAEEATLAWMSDPTVNETGEIIDPLEQYYDLDADLKATLGDLAASGGGNAGRDANGDVITTESEYVLPADVLGGVQLVLQNPAAGKEALRRFAALKERDPVAAENVLKVAEKNKIPAEAAMLWNEAAKVYGYSKYKETLSQQSEGGARARDMKEGVNWLAELTKSVIEGSFKGEQPILPGIGTGAMGGVTPLGGIQVAQGGKASEEDLKVFDGWTLQKQKAYIDVNGEMKLGDNNIVVDKVSYDRNKGEWVLYTTTTGTKDKKTLRFPNEKFESDVYPTLIGENKDKIEGIGKYVNTKQVSPDFEAKNAQNMSGAQIQPRGRFNPQKTGGRFDPK